MCRQTVNLACLFGLLVFARSSVALDAVELSVANWSFADWQAGATHLVISVANEPPTATLTIDHLESESTGRLTDVRLECGGFEFDNKLARCVGAQLQIGDVPSVGPVSAEGNFQADLTREQLDIDIRVHGFETIAEVKGQMTPEVQLRVRVDGLEVSAALARSGIEAPNEITLAPGATSSFDLELTESSRGPRVDGRWSLQGLSFDSADGTLAGAAIAVEGAVASTFAENNLDFELSVEKFAGEVLVDTFYAAFDPDWNLQVTAIGSMTDNVLDLTSIRVSDDALVNLDATARFQGLSESPTLSDAKVAVNKLQFPQVRDRYLSSLVDSLGLAEVQLNGDFRGTAQWAGGELVAWRVQSSGLSVEDDLARASLVDADLDWHWTNEEAAVASRIAWRGGSLYGIPVGSSGFSVSHSLDSVVLIEPARIPLAEGALLVDALSSSSIGTDEPTIRFRGSMEPLSLQVLTTAFGWPAFAGTIGGQIPGVTYEAGVLRLDGTLVANVFDGAIRMAQVELERPLGVAPSFSGQLEINGIDLELLTGAFEFGKITGRLDGYVRDLRLVNWEPVAFDAALVTPAKDRSSRKISQRAIDSLSSIGGGPAGAVSRTFLRFFEDFSYRDIGLSCTLAYGVCDMRGVGPAGNDGYYIVRGSGIPRIDVVGYQRRVDWRALISRLQAATQGAGPVIDG